METKLMVHIYQNTRRHNAECYYQAKSGSTAHKIPLHLLNPKVPHFVPIVSQMQPIHTLPPFVFNTYFSVTTHQNLHLQNDLSSSDFRTKHQ